MHIMDTHHTYRGTDRQIKDTGRAGERESGRVEEGTKKIERVGWGGRSCKHQSSMVNA